MIQLIKSGVLRLINFLHNFDRVTIRSAALCWRWRGFSYNCSLLVFKQCMDTWGGICTPITSQRILEIWTIEVWYIGLGRDTRYSSGKTKRIAKMVFESYLQETTYFFQWSTGVLDARQLYWCQNIKKYIYSR